MKKEKDNLTKTDYTKVHANYRLLFKILFESLNLSKAKVVCLYMLGHPYYYHKLQKKYPKLKIITIESPEIAKLYRQEKCYIVNITKNIASFWPKELKMKFDYIIMNPPYNGNLHLKILEEAMKHGKKTISLEPAIWLKKNMISRPMSKWRKVFQGKVESVEVLDHRTSNDLFGLGNTIEELGIFTLSDKGTIDLEKFGFENDIEYSLYKKIDISSKTETFNANKIGNGGWTKALCEKAGKIAEFRKNNDLPVYCWHGGKTCREAVIDLRENKEPGQVLYFDSANERENFIKSLDTKFMNWYYYEFIVPGDNKIICYMWRIPKDYINPRTGLKGYESEWTDEDFYKFFDLTADEIKIIEDTMEKYK